MPTVPPANIPTKASRYFPGLNRNGRKPGSKNKGVSISIRREIEKVYDLMGSDGGLWEWAHEHKSEFYPLALKILASYEIKRDAGDGEQAVTIIVSGSPDPIDVTPQHIDKPA